MTVTTMETTMTMDGTTIPAAQPRYTVYAVSSRRATPAAAPRTLRLPVGISLDWYDLGVGGMMIAAVIAMVACFLAR